MSNSFKDVANAIDNAFAQGKGLNMVGRGTQMTINGQTFNLKPWNAQTQQAPQTTNSLSRAAYEKAFKPIDAMTAADTYLKKPMGMANPFNAPQKTWEDYGNEAEQEEEYADDFEKPVYSKPTSRTQQELADRRMQRMIADRVRRNRQNMMNIGKRRKYVQGVVNESHNYDMNDPDQRDEFTRYTGAAITEDGDIEGVELPSDDFNKRYGL